jgi:hypothetical protein
MDSPKLSSLALIAAFLAAQMPFALAEWVAVGDAPGETGMYDVILQATYNGVTGTFPLQLLVNNTPYEIDNLTVEPVYPLDRENPIVLKYDILLNGSEDFDMVNNSIDIYYASGDALLKSAEGALSFDNESWVAEVTVPLKGEYRAVISLVVSASNGSIYGGQFVTYFRSDSMSPDLTITHEADKIILTPSESFEVFLEAEFEGEPLPDLDIFKGNIYGTLKDLNWDEGDQVYDASFTAPVEEGIYLLSIYAEDQDYITQSRIYVADISKAKASTCPITSNRSCSDMEGVRKCVYDYKSDLITVTEQQLASCFESATGGILYGSVICEGQYKGDLDGDQQLDADDLEVMQNMILPLSQSGREEYLECADYDNDDDVDEDDLTCLTNVVSDKWFGDFNGGICFDAEYSTPLKCDLTNDDFITDDDVAILQDIIAAGENDIEMPAEILGTCDFDENSQINQEDETCLQYFNGMELANPESLLGAGQTIPAYCMGIYNLDECQGIKGDLNGDLVIDELDEILIMLVEADQVGGYNMACADVNGNGAITDEDVECVKSYTAGDRDSYFICIGCTDNTPAAYRSTYEICGDGFDNNCDGYTDRTGDTGDLCQCGENTPCYYVYDTDGGTTPGVSDGNVKVCRKVSWSAGGGNSSAATTGGTGGWQWMASSALTCDSSKQCKTMLCSSTVYKCAYGKNGWKWYDLDEGVPKESEDPNAVPKTCGDTYDNDCSCGDVKCKTKKGQNMFSSSEFWTGAAIGLVTGIVCPPCAMYLSLGASLISMGTDNAKTQAGLTGFSLGAMFGGGIGRGIQAQYGTAGTAGTPASAGVKPVAANPSGIAGTGGTSQGTWGQFGGYTPPTPAAGAAATTPTFSQGFQSFYSSNMFGIGQSASSMSISTIATLGAATIATSQAQKEYKEQVYKWKSNANCTNSSSS